MTAVLPVLHRRSALEAFRCPRRYKAIYVDGVPDESDPARRGSAFHAAAKLYTRMLIAARETQDLTLAAAALQAGLVECGTPAHLVGEVTSLFWGWAERFELNLDAVLLVEERQQDEEGHTWQPDLVYAFDDLLEIDDYKTHFQAFTEAQAHAEFQSKWYLWQARKLWPGFRRYRIVYHFIRFGATVAAEFDDGDLDQMEPQVDAIVETIDRAQQADEWPAIPGQQCSYCTLTCPVVDHPERVELRLLTRADAERLAGFKLALDRAAKLTDDALRAWCDANGPVVVGGMQIGFTEAPTTEFPISPVMQLLTDNGVTPTFTVGKTALRPYLKTKRYAHLRPDLEALARVAHGTCFGAKKAGGLELPAEEE